MARYRLNNGMLSVLVDSRGAGIINCNLSRNGKVLELMPDTSLNSCLLGCDASFLMIPYSNRIENGVFTFDNKTYTLRNGEDHSIHGDVLAREWTVAHVDDLSIVLNLSKNDFPDFNWPWDFDVSVRYALEKQSLVSAISLVNKSDSDMPAGMGWHPFYSRHLTMEGEPVVICFRSSGVYPDANDTRIPSGPPRVDKRLDFSKPRALSHREFIDSCYSGYDGKGYIHWPLTGIKISYDCSPECTHMVLYNPIDMPFFALEPVTNANNGVNLFSCGDKNCGIRRLPPGQTMTASWNMKVEITE